MVPGVVAIIGLCGFLVYLYRRFIINERKEFQELVESNIAELRKETGDYWRVRWLKDDAKKKRYNLADFGLSEQELDKLERVNFITNGKNLVGEAKNIPNGTSVNDIARRKEDVKRFLSLPQSKLGIKYNLGLAEFGVSEQEIDKLLERLEKLEQAYLGLNEASWKFKETEKLVRQFLQTKEKFGLEVTPEEFVRIKEYLEKADQNLFVRTRIKELANKARSGGEVSLQEIESIVADAETLEIFSYEYEPEAKHLNYLKQYLQESKRTIKDQEDKKWVEERLKD